MTIYSVLEMLLVLGAMPVMAVVLVAFMALRKQLQEKSMLAHDIQGDSPDERTP